MKNQSGQALVLVLLSLAVVLTVVLYILSRGITDVAVSSRQEESVRAFSAAEAGIEKALVIGNSSSLIGDASYTASVSNFAEGSKSFNYPILLYSGDSSTIWFASHDATPGFTGNVIEVCWGKPGTRSDTDTTPAAEIIIYYGSTKVARVAYDSNNSRRVTNHFSPPNSGICSIGGTNYAFGKNFNLSSLGVSGTLQFMRVKMLYNTDVSHPIGVNVNFSGNSVLPSQGKNIVSTGIAGVSNRRIEVFQGWPEIPSIFEYPIYSPSGLTK